MVRLLSLRAQNFKKLRLDAPLRFSDGITLISGLNESGKSSVLDAILYALFGRVTRPPKAKNEDLVAYATENGTVGLEFGVGEKRFRVMRTLHKLKPSQATLEELTDKSTQVLAKGQEKVNEEIVRLLGGITYHEIVSSTVVAQKELNKLIELNKDDRKRVVNAFLNLESFNAVMTDLVEEKKSLEGTASRVGKVPAEKEKLDLLKRELEQFKTSSEEKNSLLKENFTLGETTQELQVKFHDKDRFYNDLRQYENVLKTRHSLALELAGKKTLYDDYQSRDERLRNEIGSVEQELSKFAHYEKMEPLLAKLQEQLEVAKTSSIELSAAERSRKTREQEVTELERKLAPLEERKLRVRALRVEKPVAPYAVATALLFLGAFAGFVFNSLPIAVGLALAGIVLALIVVMRLQSAASLAKDHLALGDLRYLESKRTELAKAQQGYTLAKQDYDSTEQKLSEICVSLRGQDEFANPANAADSQDAQAILQTYFRDKQAKEALQAKLQMLTDEAGKLPSQTALSTLTHEMRELEKQAISLPLPALPDGIAYAPERLMQTLNARDEIGRQLVAAQNSVQQNLRRLTELDKYLTEHAEVPARAKSQEELVQRLERQLRVVKRAVEGIQSTGESLRNRVRPGVQGYMSTILPALTSSKYRAAVLDEDYNLQVWDPEAGEYKQREVYSGGTEDQFLLAMRLAFALALLPEAKGQKPEFVFLDEPLGTSDEIRQSGIIDYLAQDLSKKFKQIFIISHVTGLEQHVQNIIRLEDGMVAGTESN